MTAADGCNSIVGVHYEVSVRCVKYAAKLHGRTAVDFPSRGSEEGTSDTSCSGRLNSIGCLFRLFSSDGRERSSLHIVYSGCLLPMDVKEAACTYSDDKLAAEHNTVPPPELCLMNTDDTIAAKDGDHTTVPIFDEEHGDIKASPPHSVTYLIVFVFAH